VHPVVIDRTIPYGGVEVLVARDAEQRRFVGFNTGPARFGEFVFLQVAPQTIEDIEAHAVPLHTVITERRLGMVFQAGRQQVIQARLRGLKAAD
jgi:hypothetical protein